MITYVSASSYERTRARWALDAVKEAPDLVLASDWLRDIEARPDKSANAGRTPEEAAEVSGSVMGIVAGAELLWLLVPETPTLGAGVELGCFAMARIAGIYRPRMIVASGSSRDVSIFVGLSDAYFEDDRDALKWLYEIARELRERVRVEKRVPDPQLSTAARAAASLGSPPPLHRVGDPECPCRMCETFGAGAVTPTDPEV